MAAAADIKADVISGKLSFGAGSTGKVITVPAIKTLIVAAGAKPCGTKKADLVQQATQLFSDWLPSSPAASTTVAQTPVAAAAAVAQTATASAAPAQTAAAETDTALPTDSPAASSPSSPPSPLF